MADRKNNAMGMYEVKISAASEMIRNIAHQWRQPLNSLMLILANLEDAYRYNELDDMYFDSLMEKSRNLINQMSQTIDDCRYLYDSEDSGSYFNIADLVKSILYLNEERLLENDINVILSIENDDIKGFGNKGMYSQAIINVINNSIDAHSLNKSVVDKRIEIKISEEENMAVCEILDNAGGVSENIIESIFEPYVTTKDSKSGTGIGLYMTKNIIENSFNGKLECRNAQNGLLTVIKISKGKDGSIERNTEEKHTL